MKHKNFSHILDAAKHLEVAAKRANSIYIDNISVGKRQDYLNSLKDNLLLAADFIVKFENGER